MLLTVNVPGIGIWRHNALCFRCWNLRNHCHNSFINFFLLPSEVFGMYVKGMAKLQLLAVQGLCECPCDNTKTVDL